MTSFTDSPTNEWKETHRRLNDAEIRALPFELKMCFYLAPWNISAASRIKDVNSWADVMGMGFCDNEDESGDKGYRRAKERAWNLINFLKKYGWRGE